MQHYIACGVKNVTHTQRLFSLSPLVQESRLKKEVESLERDTGVKLRVLAQNYPNTPGLAVKDYWNVDDDTVVFVADPSLVCTLSAPDCHENRLDVWFKHAPSNPPDAQQCNRLAYSSFQSIESSITGFPTYLCVRCAASACHSMPPCNSGIFVIRSGKIQVLHITLKSSSC